MRISTKGRYSLIALLYIALLKDRNFASTREIAEETGISEGYLEQLFIALRKAGIIQSVRGSQGGYFLDMPLKDISAGAVLRAVEGPLSPTECVSGTTCPQKTVCHSRQTWDDLNEGINEFVDSITLYDIVKDYNEHNDPEYTI